VLFNLAEVLKKILHWKKKGGLISSNSIDGISKVSMCPSINGIVFVSRGFIWIWKNAFSIQRLFSMLILLKSSMIKS